MSAPKLNVEDRGTDLRISLVGEWTISNAVLIEEELSLVQQIPSQARIILNGQEIEALDTAGALLLFVKFRGMKVSTESFRSDHENVMNHVASYEKPDATQNPPALLNFVQTVGKKSIETIHTVTSLVNFLGQTAHEFTRAIMKPKAFRVRELFVQLEMGCIDALPIISLVTFLIGVVIAYLFASQVERYGANIFIVDGVALAMCRELSPIIVAVVVAGRSGSAFTAQIGTMKLNEEIDALQTLGLSPMQVLVIPRVIALVLSMPLLVFLGDIVGTFGGSLIAHYQLGITPTTFIERLQLRLPLKSFIVGLVKAPFFAAFIAIIGCKMGLTVENNARSVGDHTTSTVVQSIVAVILLNAAFAIIFQKLKV